MYSVLRMLYVLSNIVHLYWGPEVQEMGANTPFLIEGLDD